MGSRASSCKCLSAQYVKAPSEGVVCLSCSSCGTDPQWPNEKSEIADKVLGPLGEKLYKRSHYESQKHGFVVRGDPNDKEQVEAKESALKDMVEWLQAKF